MAGLRALLGFFPKTSDYETKRLKLEQEYNELLAFRNSKELHHYHELEAEIKSEEFASKRKDILGLRFKNTDDYQKERQFKALKNSADIKQYLKTINGGDLARFQQLEQSDTLKEFRELEEYVKSPEFAQVKKDTSGSKKAKFARSDLAKTLEQYYSLSNSERIKGYLAFTGNKHYPEFEQAVREGLPGKVEKLAEMEDKAAEMKELTSTSVYKSYKQLADSPNRKFYDELHGSDELEAYNDLAGFVQSDEFKRQKTEIEKSGFKDTEAYKKLRKFDELRKSADIRFFQKYSKSKALKNYQQMHDSERLKEYETLKTYVDSDEFIRFKQYATMSPKKRWQESKEYARLKEFETLAASEKIKWYLGNIESPRFDWHRKWQETFSDDFSTGKLDQTKWITRYYYGEELLKDSYSLSSDKHFVTDGKNIELDTSRLIISLKKEQVRGKSWDQKFGFVTRDFGYTSGLISTGKSFRQKYGTFDAKIRICESGDIINAFWMVGKLQIPHINIMKAYSKMNFGHIWGGGGNAKPNRFGKTYKRRKFHSDYFIFSLEWTPQKLVWKINGLEVASATTGIPDEAMYLVFSSGLQKEVRELNLPANMEIDWVRCFQREDLAG